MSLQIAQAAVDDATIHFDKLYSYCIPPRLNDKVWPGSMVLVPFGRGNKPRMAVELCCFCFQPAHRFFFCSHQGYR